MSAEKITIEAIIAAQPSHVWLSWTDPSHITHWNFASDDWCCPSASNDLRVGGKLKSRMEAKDGSFGFDFEGTYHQVKPFELLEYSMEDGRRVITTFKDLGDATMVVTVFDAESENSIDMQRQGWQAILNNFKSYVESNGGIG